MPGAFYVPAPAVNSTSPVARAPTIPPTPRARGLQFGDGVDGTISFGGRSLPLPAGHWRIVASLPTTRADGVIIDAIAALQEQHGAVRALLLLAGNDVATPAPAPFRADGNCDRSDLLYTYVIQNDDLGPQDCQTVDYLAVPEFSRDGKDVLLRAAFGDLEQEHFIVPGTFVSASFRFADHQNLLLLRYYFNPEAEGVTPSAKSNWLESDWNKYNIAQHADKRSYRERVIAWVDAWEPVLRAAWQGKAETGSSSMRPVRP